MIKLEIHKGELKCGAEGNRLTLLADTTIITAHLLAEILKDCPSMELKRDLVKFFFERTLGTLKDMGCEV